MTRLALTLLCSLLTLPTWAASPVTLQGVQYSPMRTDGTNGIALVWVDPNSPRNTLNGAGFSELFDLSLHGNRLTNATAANQPTLTNAANGLKLAWFDGTNDFLKALAFTLNQPETVIGMFRDITWASNKTMADGGTVDSMRMYNAVATPNIYIYSGVAGVGPIQPTLGTPFVGTFLFNNTASYGKLNLGANVTGNLQSSTAGGGFTLGSGAAGSGNANMEAGMVLVFQGALNSTWQQYHIVHLARRYAIEIY